MEKYELTYKVEKGQTILRLLGEDFFNVNKASGNFIYKNKLCKLKEKMEIKNIKEKEIKIEIRFFKTLLNKNDMFRNCDSLIKFSVPIAKNKGQSSSSVEIFEEEENLIDSYFENFNSFKETFYDNLDDIDNLFGYSELLEKPRNSKDNSNSSKKTTIKNYMNELKNIPEHFFNLSRMFYNCTSLLYVDDKSEWNDYSLNNIYEMFYNCPSLISLPDMSNWNINNVKDLGCVFQSCSSLKSLPDISNWNTNNVTKMNGLFYECKSLVSLPDISKWNTNKVTDLGCLFYSCSSLKSLPDISNWNTKEVTDFEGLFYNCSSLETVLL